MVPVVVTPAQEQGMKEVTQLSSLVHKCAQIEAAHGLHSYRLYTWALGL
jgi:hypothetical protein